MRRPAKPARPTADQDLSRAVGFMTIPFRNGEYQGEFKIGRRVGKGTFTWHNSDVYTGQWKDDCMSGAGSYAHASGDRYTGEFLNDAPHGEGTFVEGRLDVRRSVAQRAA